MNQENFALLRDMLKYLGFGDNLLYGDQLDQAIERQPAEFHLYDMVKYDEDTRLEIMLFFRKSSQSDIYFFNKYLALLRHEGQPDRDRQQTFYISRGTGITCKEAYNLLQGRSVYKKLTDREGIKYEAWVQLNFDEKDDYDNYKTRQFGSRYGFDLEKTLERYPIRELKHPDLKATLLRSLQRGNLHLITLEKPTKNEKLYIEASPQFKTINIYPSSIIHFRLKADMRKHHAEFGHETPVPASKYEPAPEEDEMEGSEELVRQEEITEPVEADTEEAENGEGKEPEGGNREVHTRIVVIKKRPIKKGGPKLI